MKIGVHFNCQNEGIADSLRALLPDAEIVNFHSATDLPGHVIAERAAILNACDHVITSHFDARHGLLSMEALQRSARRCHVLPGFSFAGYHPDMCYVHADGQMLHSITGGYHSRIAVAGYLAGVDTRQTQALYNRLVFARLGYFAAFEEQVALMAAMWARDGIEAEPLLRGWSRAGCFAYTINHPKIIVLLDLARIACARMGITPANPDVDSAQLPDRLSRGAMHPVFPDIAAALGVAPEGCFSAGTLEDRQIVVSPTDFISDCFARYIEAPPDELRATPGVAQAMDAIGLPMRIKARRITASGRPRAGMMLMTHHGTLLRQGPSRGQLSHAPVAIAEWQAAYLRLEDQGAQPRQSGGGLQGADIEVAADGRRVLISRAGALLSANAQADEAGFTHEATEEPTHFLLLNDADLALLQRLGASDWFVEDRHETVGREAVAVEAGPVLRFGPWRIDLVRHFPIEIDGAPHVVLDGALRGLRAHAPPPEAQAALPEPGRALGLVGTPVFLPPPIVADGAQLAWMRRSAVAAQALDGAPQATQALLRRRTLQPDSVPGLLSVRFCEADAPGAAQAARWADAAVRLHVLASVAPPDAVFLVPPGVAEEAVQAWCALGFGALTFRRADPATAADLLWLENTSIAELPAEALAGCRARIGAVPLGGGKLFWPAGVLPEIGAVLRQLGFETLEPDRLPALSDVARAAQAGWIVGRTGQLPLVFCQPGTRIIELCDKAGFVQDDWVLSAKLGLVHGMLACAELGGLLVPDPDRLMRLIALMAAMP